MLTRNTPTTYYFEGDNEAGLDFELARAFAEQHGMTLRVKVAFSLPELFAMLARGEGHLAAAGLTQSAHRDEQFQASFALSAAAGTGGIQVRKVASPIAATIGWP